MCWPGRISIGASSVSRPATIDDLSAHAAAFGTALGTPAETLYRPGVTPAIVNAPLASTVPGADGVLLVNRLGYEVIPYPPPSGGRGQKPPPRLEPKTFTDPKGFSAVVDSPHGSATHRHIRNFLDAMRSRQKPNCDIEVGIYAALPCLLAVVSVKTGKTVCWDGNAARTD